MRSTIRLLEQALVPGGEATVEFRLEPAPLLLARGVHTYVVGYEEVVIPGAASSKRNATILRERVNFFEVRETTGEAWSRGSLENVVSGALAAVGRPSGSVDLSGGFEHRLVVKMPRKLREPFLAAKAKVAYEAGIHVDIAGARDFTDKISLPVALRSRRPLRAAPVRLRYPSRADDSALSRRNLPVNVDLRSSAVRRGGDLEVRLGVPCTRTVPIHALSYALVRFEKMHCGALAELRREVALESRLPVHPTESHQVDLSFEIPVASDLIPTCEGRYFSMTYALEISLGLRRMRDPSISIPITVR